MRQQYTLTFGFLLKNGHARFHVWRLNVGDQSPFEPVAQPILQARDLFWKFIRSYDDLFMGFVKRVEGMKKFLLGSLLTSNELNIVKNQNIYVPKFALELIHFVASERAYKLVHKRFRTEIVDFESRTFVSCLMTYGVNQVSFSQTDTAVDKQRVIVLARLVCHRHRSCVSELIACANDEVFKSVLGIEIGQPLRFFPFLFFFAFL